MPFLRWNKKLCLVSWLCQIKKKRENIILFRMFTFLIAKIAEERDALIGEFIKALSSSCYLHIYR
jgi:hypothetical protein